MTEQPRAAGPESAGPASGGSVRPGSSTAAGADRVVIRDKRRIDQTGSATGAGAAGNAEAAADQAPAGAGDGAAGAGGTAEATTGPAGAADAGKTDAPTSPETDTDTDTDTDEARPDTPAEDGEVAEVLEAETPTGAEGAVVDEPAQPVEPASAEGRGPLGAELEALRAELDERTRDLQRVTAEYSNYRKRVDRDRGKVAEQATGAVLAALLPVLDDLDRAREHGDLVGPFGTVAEQLVTTLGKFGLTPFGEPGDPFDPTRHEAVSHQTSAEVTEPTCVTVMRRGYLHGDRLLRAALVGVADPE